MKVIGRSIRLTDQTRGRALPVDIFYPTGRGLFPVIIFSHGSAVPPEVYHHFGKYWASHGYVTLFPTHRGKCETARPGRDWKLRPEDIGFLVDSLPLLEKRIPALKSKMDRARIGLTGHSLGAHTALLLAGISEKYFDPRISAVLLLSPPGIGFQGLRSTSFKKIRPPVLTITGSRDSDSFTGSPAPWRRAAFLNGPKKNNHLISIRGVNHYSFMDAVVKSDRGKAWFPNQTLTSRIQMASLGFWNKVLKKPKFLSARSFDRPNI